MGYRKHFYSGFQPSSWKYVTSELVGLYTEQRPGLSCFRIIPSGPLPQVGRDSHGVGRLGSMRLRNHGMMRREREQGCLLLEQSPSVFPGAFALALCCDMYCHVLNSQLRADHTQPLRRAGPCVSIGVFQQNSSSRRYVCVYLYNTYTDMHL